MNDAERECGNCDFWQLLTKLKDRNRGSCHRHAPRAAFRATEQFTAPTWPVVYSDEWCGDFQPRTHPVKAVPKPHPKPKRIK